MSLAQRNIRLGDGISMRKRLNQNLDYSSASFICNPYHMPKHIFPPIIYSEEDSDYVKKKNPVRRKRYLHAPSSKNIYLKASYSLEAAMVMPIFLYAMIAILFLMRVISVQYGVKTAIDDTAKLVSVSGGNLEDGIVEPTSLSVAAIATTKIAKNGTPLNFVKLGIAGFNFLNTEVTDSEVKIVVKYYMKVPLAPDFGHKGFLITQRAYAKRFTGYHLDDENKDEIDEYVFVTKYGEAYHTDLNCSYLKLSIRSVPESSLKGERNNNGHKYTSCQYCGKKGYGAYYITDDGTGYHTRLDCPGLKRTINRVKKEEAEKTCHACQKCAA